MNVKKSIAIIITLVLLILPMMTMPIQAATIGKVANVRTEKQGNVIAFYWNTVSNADGYDIFIATSGTEYKYIGSVSSSEARLIGFKEEKEYSAKVRAYQEKSNGTKSVGEFSSPITINKAEEVTLDKVKTLTASQNGGYVTLNWSKVSNATGYEVYVKVPNLDYICIGTVNTNNAILQGFEDNITYQFKVKPYQEKSNGTKATGEFSPEKKLTVRIKKYEDDIEEQEETEPGKVRNLTIDEVDGNKAYISWSKVSDADGYEIYGAKSNGKYTYIDTVYKNSVTLKKLDYNTTYKIKVKAFKEGKNGLIYGEESSYEKFTTDKNSNDLGSVTKLVADVDGRNVTVSWKKVANADGYSVWIKRKNEDYYFTGNTTKTSLKSNSVLDYDTKYTIKVVAYMMNNHGKIEYSDDYETVTFTTEKKKVERATNLTAEVKNRNEAYLQWWPVDGADGYEVYLAKENKSFKKIDDIEKNYMTLYSDELDYNTSYQVKVVAYEKVNGKKVYAEDSNIAKFKTEKESSYENNEKVPQVKNVKAKVTGDTVTLTWNTVKNAAYYEIDFTIPGLGGSTKYTLYTNSKVISGLTEKEYCYTARVRAYQYVNGKLVAGAYSEVSEFTAK